MTATATATADPTLDLVRHSVQKVLTRSPSYRALGPVERQRMAHDMVRVARYMVDANGETAGTPMKAVVSTGLADQRDVVDNTGHGKTASDRFQQGGGTATNAGVNALGSAIKKVDFPGFVGGLVEGVFNAIVTSSIRQMEAYGALVSNVAKSVDEYMRDNITENQARDYLADKYPKHIKVDTSAKGGPKAIVAKKTGARGGRGGAGGRGFEAGAEAFADPAQSQLPDFMKDLGLPEPVSQLNNKTVEDTLVPAARRRMAMDRQQLLATMVLMGINRLIVTDGKISASCVFELNTSESMSEYADQASSYDEHRSQSGPAWSWLFFSGGRKSSSANFDVSTSSTSDSAASIDLHTQLAGNVDINFRSETFPLEKMADMIQIKEIEQKAPAAAVTPQLPAAPGAPLPPPPALPALPGMPGQQPAAAAPPAPAPTAGG